MCYVQASPERNTDDRKLSWWNIGEIVRFESDAGTEVVPVTAFADLLAVHALSSTKPETGSVSVDFHPATGCKFGIVICIDTVVGYQGIEIGRYLLAIERTGLACEGHEPDIAQVVTAYTTEVGVQKTDQHVIRIVAAGRPTPPFEDIL